MKKYVFLLLLLVLGVVAIVDLLHPGFAVTHDGQDHIARIANFYQNLSIGVLVPRWAPNLNWGYGHPILEFLYPLPSYLASLFHALSFSLIDSTKLVYGLSLVASGIAMFVFVATLWGIEAGFVSGFLYMYAPYHFVELYVRGDIGELLAFVFIPLVFWGCYKIYQTQKYRYLLLSSVFLACLILAHNAISLMTLPFLLFFMILLIFQSREKGKTALSMASSFFLGFLLSAFFWLPALVEGQYTLRNIVTKGEYASRFVSLPSLLWGKWSYGGSGEFSVQMGILQWVSVLLSAVLLSSKKYIHGFNRHFVGGLILYTLISLFLMLSWSHFVWQRVMLLQNFQFPWRFLADTMWTTAILGGFLISKLKKGIGLYILVGVVLFVLLVSKDYIHAKAYMQKPENFFTGIYNSTTDTGESSPIWSVRFMGKRSANPLEIIAGDAQIAFGKRTAIDHRYTIHAQETSRLLENTLYFPGWKVLVDGREVPVQFQDAAYRGLMTFSVGTGTHQVEVVYKESRMRLIGDTLSIVGLIMAGIVMAVSVVKKKL